MCPLIAFFINSWSVGVYGTFLQALFIWAVFEITSNKGCLALPPGKFYRATQNMQLAYLPDFYILLWLVIRHHSYFC